MRRQGWQLCASWLGVHVAVELKDMNFFNGHQLVNKRVVYANDKGRWGRCKVQQCPVRWREEVKKGKFKLRFLYT